MAESNGPTLAISLWTLTVIPLLFMILRIYSKTQHSKAFGLDDGLLALSWIFIFAYTTTLQISMHYGLGDRLENIEPEILPTTIQYMYIGEFFGFFAMPLGKTSFCVTLLRLTTVRWQRWILWFIMISFNTTMSLLAVLTWVQCRPVQKLWDSSVEGECWPYKLYMVTGLTIGAYSALADFALAICPWLIIRKVRMRQREKWGLIIAMSMGCLAGVCCVVKTAYIPGAATWVDFTYSTADMLIWALAESSITIIAASLPFLRLILKDMSSYSGSQSLKLSIRLPSQGDNATGIRSQQKPHKSHAVHPEDVRDDEASDRSILAETRGEFGKIMRSREVRIEYNDEEDHHRCAGRTATDMWTA
ncbi:hypothetical protein P153DRAFT_333811 [Dothidotthia symphoricarpi CBS 119687]|uniref:Rhodopsin domain-containing protein n=1 Tax=Dothidotthia symphoricarpi CBS 119687 TaxID=1392245 RepID=A0A6A6AMH3_9PLEO|nr:uncharacterized protein P153DRAFT_333811 [Dothidotthia symphoricarpi CBS 119687]KAF2132990.1 hypothetical protein P153DRAFT_333811 [Dothidotthia symphoricarpi CBS 119687]